MDSRNRTKPRQEQYGVCHNRTCDLYGQPQEVHHGDYTCSDPKCKKKLTPCAPPKEKKNKLPLIIGGAVLAVAVIVGGIFVFSGGNGNSDKAMGVDSLQIADSVELAAAQPDTLFVRDTLVMRDTLVVQDTLVVRDTIVEKSATAASSKQTPKVVANNTSATPQKTSTSTNGTLSLSYGTYTGAIKNGYPNGQGKLVYRTARQINKYDSKGRTAQPGDYVQGEFVNGFFTIGKHYNAQGELIESINVGVADGVYEAK